MNHREPTHYQTLGVVPSATDEEIRTAYWALAMKLHPDLPKNQGRSEEKFKAVTFAYGVLKNARHRAQHDAFLGMTRAKCPACEGTGRTYKQKGFTNRVASVCATCKGVGYAIQ